MACSPVDRTRARTPSSLGSTRAASSRARRACTTRPDRSISSVSWRERAAVDLGAVDDADAVVVGVAVARAARAGRCIESTASSSTMRPVRPVSSCELAERRRPRDARRSRCRRPGSVHAARALGDVGQPAQQQARSSSSTHTLYAATRWMRAAASGSLTSPSKLRVALLAERGHALDEVGRRGGERLEVRLRARASARGRSRTTR